MRKWVRGLPQQATPQIAMMQPRNFDNAVEDALDYEAMTAFVDNELVAERAFLPKDAPPASDAGRMWKHLKCSLHSQQQTGVCG